MPLYAGVAETDITPPLDIWMAGYARRSTGATGVLDALGARCLVLEDGRRRLALLTADVAVFPFALAAQVRSEIAEHLGTTPSAVLLHATHTHHGPLLGTFQGMGPVDAAYVSMLARKLCSVARQAAAGLRPAHLTYGDSSAQIGVNRRRIDASGAAIMGPNYAGPVAPTVQTLCVNGADGRMFAMLFSHACHPVSLGREDARFSADWPGAAVATLKARFAREGAEGGITPDAVPMFFQGCCGDIDPVLRGDREAVLANGVQIADAAHAARWNAHGRMEAALAANEAVVEMPVAPPPAAAECDRRIAEAVGMLDKAAAQDLPPAHIRDLHVHIDWWRAERARAESAALAAPRLFGVQALSLGGVDILAFPAEMFVRYQLDFQARHRGPLFAFGTSNGCWNYLPTAEAHAEGGYEVLGASAYYGEPMFSPESDELTREAVARLLGR